VLPFLLAAALPASAQDAPAEARVHVSNVAPPRVYVGQTFEGTVVFTYDAKWFGAHAVPVFRQPMDVPVHLDVPWLRGVAGATIERAPPGPSFPVDTVAVNDAVVPAWRFTDEFPREAPMRALHVEAVIRADREGEIVLPAPAARFAWAQRIDEDPVLGRVPRDPRDAVVRGADTRVQVLPLPQEGRPAEFDGAIGTYVRVESSSSVASAVIGTPFSISLTIAGVPPVGDVPAPRLDSLAGFHVLGSLVKEEGATRTFTYSVAVTDASVREVPAIPFAFFDPEDGAYRVVRTQPIPLEVRRKAGAPVDEPVYPRPPPAKRPEVPVTPPWRWAALGIATLLFAVLVPVLIRRAARSRRGDGVPDPAGDRLSQADAALRAAPPDDPAAFAAALREALAARLGVPASALPEFDLAERLAATGLAPGVAARAARAHHGLEAARYGGAPAVAPAELASLASDLRAAAR
jgi:hypothetical protein